MKVGNRKIAGVRKLPRTIKAVPYQTGKRISLSRDRRYKALAPGKRLSKSGEVYYEYRRNRSDLRRKRI